MVVYYHYTSTRNAAGIKKDLTLKKGYENIVLTTLEPEKFNRDEILHKIYGRNYDRFMFGNRADWIVIVNSSNLDPKKLRKRCDDIYEYPENISVQPNDIIDKPCCITPGSGSGNNDGEHLYHYTNVQGADAIRSCLYIKKSSQTGYFGEGVYMTDLKPTDFFRSDILKNNYGGVAAAFKGRADCVVNIKKSSLDLNKLKKVSVAVTGKDRSIFVYEDEIKVNANDVYNKPKCYRAL